MTLLLTGATSSIGRVLLPRLDSHKWEVHAPTHQEFDLAQPGSFIPAVEGVHTLVHLATSPSAPSRVDGTGTRRLIDACAQVGIAHFVYLSITGVDKLPINYYEHKFAAERQLASSGLPHTILRATQFHGSLDHIFDMLSGLPFVFPIPKGWSIQPVEVSEVASALIEAIDAGPQGRLPDFGGPEVLPLEVAARQWLDTRNRRKRILRISIPGVKAKPFLEGHNCCPNHRRGRLTFARWLEQHR